MSYEVNISRNPDRSIASFLCAIITNARVKQDSDVVSYVACKDEGTLEIRTLFDFNIYRW